MVCIKQPRWNYFWCRNVIDVSTVAVNEKKKEKINFLHLKHFAFLSEEKKRKFRDAKPSRVHFFVVLKISRIFKKIRYLRKRKNNVCGWIWNLILSYIFFLKTWETFLILLIFFFFFVWEIYVEKTFLDW